MATTPELFVLPWGLYPRRVLIYLAEKGLLSSSAIKITDIDITMNGVEGPDNTPKGTFPVLRLPDGTLIRQSVAIMDYFEDVCTSPDPKQAWQLELSKNVTGVKNMRGETAEEKARTRDMLSLVDEATSQFGFACHKGSKLFVSLEPTYPMASKLILENCNKNLKLLSKYYEEDRRISSGGATNIADCVLFATVQFARNVYGKDLLAGPELGPLRQFFEDFGKRGSVQTEVQYPGPLVELARQWLPVEE